MRQLLVILSIMLVMGFSFGCSGTTEPEVIMPDQVSGSNSGSSNEIDDSQAGDVADDDSPVAVDANYPIADTNQVLCYGATREIVCPADGAPYFGQDSQIDGNQPKYRDNGDGTITDLVTGLMWQQDPGDKMTLAEAIAGADSFELAGYDDWRLPGIKELYSLIDFSGTDPSGDMTGSQVPFIDTDYFDFEYGDPGIGDRIIDSQFATTSIYVSTTMGGNPTMFGVNFADGRIKGYPYEPTPLDPNGKGFFVLYVRGNDGYGINDYTDNGDGTITDRATGLMWAQADSGQGMNWEDALAWAQEKNAQNYLGYDDWRLPNVKELQSIVDYTRSPDTTDSAAIDPLFTCTEITNEAGQKDWSFYWSGTTHVNNNGIGDSACYVSFGRALGYMNGHWMDVHGAGAQRSDPKEGDPAEYPTGHGPQGDAIRIFNFVRLVRDAG